jgi:hypothetical protein
MKIKLINLHVVALTFLFLLNSCKHGKDITKIQDSEEIRLPCTGKEYQSDKSTIRASSMGNSIELNYAKEIAMNNAEKELARQIEVKLESFLKNYSKQNQVGTTKDYENVVEGEKREIISEVMQGLSLNCEKAFKEKDQTFTYYVAIEISRENLKAATRKKISDNDKKQLDQDYKNFDNEWDKAMNKEQ